jgi:hypothetical protein
MMIKRNVIYQAGKLTKIGSNSLKTAVLAFLTSVLMAFWPQTSAQQTISSSVAAISSKHALIIAIGKYANPSTTPLLGTKHDILSAQKMAAYMGVRSNEITVLKDEQATLSAIKAALVGISAKTIEGDKVFVYFSGHGTRFKDESSGGCVEALLAYDGGTLTNSAMAELLQSMSQRADKVLVFYDACHSGGVLNARPLTARSGDLLPSAPLVAKFSPSTDASCNVPVNVRTRTLSAEVVKRGTLPNDIIHISSSAHNEASFDDSNAGGLATQYFRDCLLGEAKDLDKSGAISVEEIKSCAQQKVNMRLASYETLKPHNYQLSGNQNFIPAWFNLNSPQRLPPPIQTVQSVNVEKEISQEDALNQIFAQRNAKTKVTVTLDQSHLLIGREFLGFTVTSDIAGYVYVALLGSDAKTLYLLFPNEIDQANRIEANSIMRLPRPDWRMRSVGPVGVGKLLVIVSGKPRNIASLDALKTGPFVSNLNDHSGRAKLGWFLGTNVEISGSDTFGASLVEFREISNSP